MQPRGESFVVNSSHCLCRSARETDRCQLPPVGPTAMNESTASQPDAHGLPREARACLSRLREVHVGFPNWGLRLHLRPPAGPVEPVGNKVGHTGRPWRTRTVIESRHWKAAGPGLLILCSSAGNRGPVVPTLRWVTKDQKSSSCPQGPRFRNSSISKFFSEEAATIEIAGRSARKRSLAGARRRQN
jgi:hypothetical protein